MFSFKPLRILLVEKEISKMEFIELVGISSSTAAKIWKNEYIAMKIIDDICNILECPITDVVIHIPDLVVHIPDDEIIYIDADPD